MKDSVDLAGIGEVPPDWMHRQKEVSPAEAQPLPGAYLKWYDVHPTDEAVADTERSQARAFLEHQTDRGALAFRNELGFVVLHRSGTFHFLIVCVWREVNELWQVLYAKDTGGTYQQVADVERFRPLQCVWELGPTAHERQAWSRYLFSARDGASKWAYVDDVYQGAV
ncbi:hypothetical protein OG555_24535 [Kribbella sp. NBC_01484]|uniref:hypothetical protein n=1 Tax=Kribbella sp. NBC_01484 TaxID=2903579 RepID=UPI002E37AB7A|nr:hypothetical protein [Kribbella sp. NBC_01484]